MGSENLPAIDQEVFNELKDLVMDDGPEFLIELLGDFVTDAENGIQAMQAASLTRDAEMIEQTAHRMKSSSAHLGALGMARLCETLQCLGRSGAVTEASDLVGALHREFTRVRESLDATCRSFA